MKMDRRGARALQTARSQDDLLAPHKYLSSGFLSRDGVEPLHAPIFGAVLRYLFSDEASAMLVFSAPKVRPHCSLWQRHRSPGSVRFQAELAKQKRAPPPWIAGPIPLNTRAHLPARVEPVTNSEANRSGNAFEAQLRGWVRVTEPSSVTRENILRSEILYCIPFGVSLQLAPLTADAGFFPLN